jgi:hypothetical protein
MSSLGLFFKTGFSQLMLKTIYLRHVLLQFETRFTSITRTSVLACLSVLLYVCFISHKSFLIVMSVCTCLVWSFAGLLQEELVFVSRPIRVRLVVDKVTLGHVFLPVRPLSCVVVIPLIIHAHSFIYQLRCLNLRNGRRR